MGRWQRWSAWLTVVFIASVALPGAQPAARASATVSAQRAPEQPPSPQMRQVAPLSDPNLPSLVIDVQANPDPISVGEPLTISVAILNQAQVAARQVEVSLPVPAHSRPAANAALQSDGRAWRWTLAELPGGASATLTATLTLDRVPASGAVVVRPTVRAQRLTMPVQAVGGALVLPEDGLASRFVPGQAGRLRSADGRIEVELPARAARRALQLRQRWRAPAGERVPPGQRRLLPPFFLNAEDERGQAVHRFDQPLTLRVRYSDEQVLVRGWDESALALFWFDDEGTQQWMPIPAQVDAERNEITAQVDHFSAFTIGDLASPSTAFIPSLQAWQVGLFSGSATYSYPLELPAGPAGLKPNLSLSYSSNAIDGDSGMYQVFQAGWAGLGWSLDTGAVARNSIVINPATGLMFDTFTIVVNGQSHQLVRAEPLVSQPDEQNPSHWAWRPTDETFVRVRAVPNGTAWDGNPGRGGLVNGVWQPRYTWVLWAKDGTRYEFAEDLWYGWDRCAVANEVEFEPYKWLLSRVVDPHGNTMTYTYARNTWTGGEVRCDSWRYARGTVDRDAWPVLVEWSAHPATGAPARYRLEFVSTAREQDTAFDGADNYYGGKLNGAPRQTRRLLALRVLSNPTGSAWELVREYRLSTDYRLSPDRLVNDQPDRANPKLTLTAIQVIASDGSSALPAMTFRYGETPGVTADACTGTSWPRGDWNRLVQVENGYGGRVTFTYEQIGVASCKRIFRNHRRITGKTISDGRGNSFTWTYRYSDPALNSLGWRLTGSGDPNATQEYPNSAALYYNTYWDPNHNNQHWLATRPLKEFRGHRLVVEIDPQGWQTEHWFYQGDVGCVPGASGNAIPNDACFQQLRDREFLKGREYKTMLRTPAASGSHWIKETQQSYTVTFFDYSHAPLTGLWRAWHAMTETRELAWEGMEGLTDPVIKTTRYIYDDDGSAYVNGSTTGTNARYGNLGRVEEYDQTGARVRITKYYYAIRDDSTTYLADRVWATVIFDTSWQVLAYTAQFYDGASDPRVMGQRGLLTRVSKLYADGASGPLSGTLSSADTTYTYDAYGNRTGETTYESAGSSWVSNGLRVWGAPGNGSRAHTTTTTYDAIMRAFPERVTNPLGHVEQAVYDRRMGTLTRVTDANGAVTEAAYDGFGRLIKVARPGDTLAMPTTEAFYYDWERPFRIIVSQREIGGQAGAVRPIVRFYDGLGREIQTKSESQDGLQQIVVDTEYDGRGRVMRTSQPRYVNGSVDTTFWQYVAPGSHVAWTTTTYDGLDRPLRVTHPDGSFVGYHYGIYEGLVFHDVADENRHRTYSMYDSLGRRVKVRELSGNCSPSSWGYPWHWPEYACGGSFTEVWANDATTTYSYNALDLLTQVTDAHGNVTAMTYDALGRKIEMRDPDMGTWRYRYDANGNLTQQTDANGQTLTFRYDALDRLTAREGSDGRANYYAYDEAFGSGKGRRTSMSTYLNGVNQSYVAFHYDSRGRKVRQEVTAAGVTRRFQWTYDSADRVTAIQYPTGETVTYTYDAAWRQTSACSSLGDCYASNASYTALNQPQQLTFGNQLLQRWDYSSPMQRVQQIRVGTGADLGMHFNRTYAYEPNGNVRQIDDLVFAQRQSFSYDHRDRLTRAWTSDGVAAARDGMAQTQVAQVSPRLAAPIQPFTALASDRRFGQPVAALEQTGGRIKDATFESGSLTGSQGVDSVYGSVTLEQTAPLKGRYSARFDQAQGAYLREQFTATERVYISFYVRITALPTSSVRVLQVRNNSTTVGNIEIRPTGRLRLRVGTTTVGSESQPLQVNHLYRIGLVQIQGSGTNAVLEGYVASADEAFGAPFATLTTGTWTTPASDVRVGETTGGSTLHAIVDDLRIDSAAMPAPSTGGTGPTATPTSIATATATPTPIPTATAVPTPTPTPSPPYRPAPYDHSYRYDAIGNLLSKAGVSYSYGANGNGTGAGPHQARTVGGQTYRYDVNGNLLSGGGRTYTWQADNLPASISSGGVTETYTYDADGERLTRTANGVTTVYVAGLYEEDLQTGVKRSLYQFNGQIIAQRSTDATGLIYLHADHLGSVSLATNSSGAVVSRQDFDPWGAIRSGGIPQTALNYTGQRRDGTGLLYYHARYYDPALGRFLSADTIVPGSGALTLWPSDATAAPLFGQQNVPGPQNPQTLNRYAYVINNPLNNIDPSGHDHKPEDQDSRASCLAQIGPIDCVKVWNRALEAFRLSEELFPGEDELTIELRDAFRHGYWLALMARDIGIEDALQAGYIHEGGTPRQVLTAELFKNNPEAYWSHVMDFTNNEVSARIGAAMRGKSNKDVADAVLQALKDGKLFTRRYDPVTNTFDKRGGVQRSNIAYSAYERRNRKK
ncbi:RHS repeat-associated core domain-containing protein [Kallotenue papyrolyticum]|uniref:RHS repeat-associated core domain-containing protein n=1 Tax=Kallotenue papyrolyticum TaxID=1325125 RepID=UPI00047865B8|nr:RHS repeat-associated core domain-containing protein [Kallotenue papyrolyticum]